MRLTAMMEIYQPIRDWRPATPEIVADDFPRLASAHPALAIHFWAAWNGVDPPADRSIQAIAGKFAGRVHFVSIDIDRAENRQFCDWCGIANVPAVTLFRGEDLQDLIIGLSKPEQLAAKIEELLRGRPMSQWRKFWRRLRPF